MKGVCVWFTGLPCSGKTTTAERLTEYLAESGESVTLLDSDMIRPVLCPDLGFSREDRRSNVLRIAFVAREIVRHRGIVVVATVSPFDEDRKLVRSMFDPPCFVQVYITTPLEECERRDVKGHYAKARAGQLPMFTGISSPYEVPDDSELICDTETHSVTASALEIFQAVQYRRSESDVRTALPTLRAFV
ncbi:MAG: adenylyl-sulfate kinase [Acidobacteriaceae bacterium]|nr:adenylyl-sulfate kinase [Acidobacteriaceae bacterium]MBV9499536.1 adenylyl-sulfate kinase [Acidobacteriaceae bacterium]